LRVCLPICPASRSLALVLFAFVGPFCLCGASVPHACLGLRIGLASYGDLGWSRLALVPRARASLADALYIKHWSALGKFI
jgi:hypothetical protein